MPCAESNFFGIVLAIQQKTGGNLSETLGNLSRVLRERRKMRDKIQAVSMEAKASAAIIGALPPVVAVLVYLTTPKYIELLWLTQAGKVAMFAGGIWMLMRHPGDAQDDQLRHLRPRHDRSHRRQTGSIRSSC